MLSSEQINELHKLGDDAMLNVAEAAAVLGLAENSLNWYRIYAPERGPRYCRVGARAIRYRMGDLRSYIATRSEG